MIPEERREQNRLKILEVSTVLFIKQGVLTTTIAQIAKAAHVVDKTVLNIFGTKDSLVAAVMVRLSQTMISHLEEQISQKEYLALNGLAQIMFLQTERARILQNNPEQLLLLSEVKVMAARDVAGKEITQNYMENLTYLYRIFEAALDRGIRDGSIRADLEKDSILSMLVPTFRAFLQQLAQVKLNREFSRLVQAEKELQMYLNAIYSTVSPQK